MSVQREGTNWKLPRTVVGPLTCHLCVSECWYPGPVTVIVHEAEPDQPGDAAAPPEPGWSVAADCGRDRQRGRDEHGARHGGQSRTGRPARRLGRAPSEGSAVRFSKEYLCAARVGWYIYGGPQTPAQLGSGGGAAMVTPPDRCSSGSRWTFAVAALLAALLVVPGAGARARTRAREAIVAEQAPAAAGECGLPAASPLWIDYGKAP